MNDSKELRRYRLANSQAEQRRLVFTASLRFTGAGVD
jgi:hypothetical protein